jgi:drug/metabolite transporter (DMT)-like permease
MAIFARAAYAGGADVLGVLMVRFAAAGAILAVFMLAARRPWLRGRALRAAILMGAIGYVGQALCYFTALNYASAGLVALLLYAYPTLVCLLAAALLVASLFREPRFPGVWWSWVALGAIALVSTVVAILAFFAGLKRVGPSVASIASTLEPVVTVALAWMLLGESLAPIQLAGGALVLASAASLARKPS